jgi:hypothetical protein
VHEYNNTNTHKRSSNLTYIWIWISLILLIWSWIFISRKNHVINWSEIAMNPEKEHQGWYPNIDTSRQIPYQNDPGDSSDHDSLQINRTLRPDVDIPWTQDDDNSNSASDKTDKQHTVIVEFSDWETMRARFSQKAYNISLLNNIELYYNDSGRKIILTSSQDALHYSKLGYIIYAIVPAHTQMELNLWN